MGNGLRGSPRLRSLWIINIHSRRRGQAGRDSHSSTQPSVQTVTEPVSTVGVKLRSPTQKHTHAHKLGTCMDDLPYLNTDCDECESAERPAHASARKHAQTRTPFRCRCQPEAGLCGLPSVHTAPFPQSCYQSTDTLEDNLNRGRRKWSPQWVYVLPCKGFLSY